MNKKERNRLIISQRDAGRAYTKIGNDFGITGQAVRVIYLKEQERIKLKNGPASLLTELPLRVTLALQRHYGVKIVKYPKKLAREGPVKIEMANSIGPKSLPLIARALYNLECISNPEKWLSRKK